MTSSEGFVEISHEKKIYKVRVIKFPLPSGEIEMLITDLSAEIVDKDEFQELYFKRWPIETSYDIIKTKLQLENFTGKTVLSVLQDFYACMYLSNMVTFAKCITDDEIQKDNAGKTLKNEYKTNTNILIGKL